MDIRVPRNLHEAIGNQDKRVGPTQDQTSSVMMNMRAREVQEVVESPGARDGLA
jgi:hypothetical protein